MKKLFRRLLTAAVSLALTVSLTALPSAALSLEEARDLLKTYYVDPIPEEILNLGSLDEILDALNDPYTVYMNAEEYQSFLDFVNGDVVVGIGVSIETAFNEGFQILSVLPESPALEAGLVPGDRIIAIDGKNLTAGSDVQGAMAGEEGTQVTVTVIRQEDGSKKDFTLVRKSVPIPIVTYKKMDNIGFIDCTSFGTSTVATIEEALTELDSEVDLWIMDLRSNPGGLVTACTGSSSLFAGGGLAMIYLRDSSGHYRYIYASVVFPDLTDKPLIILTSAYSASGAEVFLGDARDYEFGIAVGQRTFGKGIAQNVFEEKNAPSLFDGDALKMTTDRFFSPNGTTNHVVGVLPTLLVSEENTMAVAELLSGPRVAKPTNHMTMELGGFAFYVDVEKALSEEYVAAFTELLEAIPPTIPLRYSSGNDWAFSPEYTPEALAAKLNLPFQSRYDFSDLEDVAQADKIRTLATYDLISGFPDGTFRADEPVTRAQLCTLLADALDIPEVSGSTAFSDVDPSAWYAGAVNAMYRKGFINGYGDGTFHPEDTVSYQEAVQMISSATAWISMDGFELANTELTEEDTAPFSQFAAWARPAAYLLTEMGIPLDQSDPAASASRGVSAGLIYDMMDVSGLFWDIS